MFADLGHIVGLCAGCDSDDTQACVGQQGQQSTCQGRSGNQRRFQLFLTSGFVTAMLTLRSFWVGELVGRELFV